jgi:hypothetical protein
MVFPLKKGAYNACPEIDIRYFLAVASSLNISIISGFE